MSMCMANLPAAALNMALSDRTSQAGLAGAAEREGGLPRARLRCRVRGVTEGWNCEFRARELATTASEEKAIMPPAVDGVRARPKAGSSAPAARGRAMTL